jgi:hypothetical protein
MMSQMSAVNMTNIFDSLGNGPDSEENDTLKRFGGTCTERSRSNWTVLPGMRVKLTV